MRTLGISAQHVHLGSCVLVGPFRYRISRNEASNQYLCTAARGV